MLTRRLCSLETPLIRKITPVVFGPCVCFLFHPKTEVMVETKTERKQDGMRCVGSPVANSDSKKPNLMFSDVIFVSPNHGHTFCFFLLVLVCPNRHFSEEETFCVLLNITSAERLNIVTSSQVEERRDPDVT